MLGLELGLLLLDGGVGLLELCLLGLDVGGAALQVVLQGGGGELGLILLLQSEPFVRGIAAEHESGLAGFVVGVELAGLGVLGEDVLNVADFLGVGFCRVIGLVLGQFLGGEGGFVGAGEGGLLLFGGGCGVGGGFVEGNPIVGAGLFLGLGFERAGEVDAGGLVLLC